MIVKTDRLCLRYVVQEDLQQVHLLHTIPAVDRYNTLGIPENEEETKSMMQDLLSELKKEVVQKHTFVIELLGDRAFIGMTAMNVNQKKYQSAEIWYKLNPIFWNQGYATEAVQALLLFGFQTLHLHRIEAGCAIENIGSVKVLEKVGMIREGQKRQTLPLKSGWSDNYEYGILKTEWKDRNQESKTK